MSEERVFEIFDLNAVIAEFPPDPESKARHRAEILVKSETLRVVVVTAITGGLLHEHHAPGPITVQVLSGSIDFTVEGESNIMSEADLISLAPGVRHSVRGIVDGAVLLTIGTFMRSPDPGGHDSRRDQQG